MSGPRFPSESRQGAFVKRTQATPERDIALAEHRMTAYLRIRNRGREMEDFR